MFEPSVRRSGEEGKIGRDEFKTRFKKLFDDPYFHDKRDNIEELCDIAWRSYLEGRKAPYTHPAGEGYHDPDYQLSDEWQETKNAVQKAQSEHENPTGPSRILLICASDRNDHSCPGEISKSMRLAQLAKETLEDDGVEVEFLNLSEVISEYGKVIYPCKGCVSTAMPLCHWPCSCYPNHSLGQVQDWMSEIYPKWVRAHGIMIVTPVYWHQAPSALKLMIDRLVCADGGNPDPTTTHGKNPELAKKIERKGWDYPKHLQGRVYSLIVHGDTTGADELKNALSNWLNEMNLIPSGIYGILGRYIGYYDSYADSHRDLDKDHDIQNEVQLAARALVMSTMAERAKKFDSLLPHFHDPRPK